MERRRIIATAAAVFLTTASGVLAIGANLGLVRLASSDTKVGTLSPVATPTATAATPPAGNGAVAAAVDPPVATPAAEPAPSVGQASPDAWGGQASPSTVTSAGPATAAVTPSTQATPAPPRGEPSDPHETTVVPSTGSGDD